MVVATAGVMAAQSATKEDGLVNQAFKITVLIGLALSIAVGIFLLYKLTTVLQDIGGTVEGVVSGFGIQGLGSTFFAPVTFIISSLFGRNGN
jgi:hypothetical protein